MCVCVRAMCVLLAEVEDILEEKQGGSRIDWRGSHFHSPAFAVGDLPSMHGMSDLNVLDVYVNQYAIPPPFCHVACCMLHVLFPSMCEAAHSRGKVSLRLIVASRILRSHAIVRLSSRLSSVPPGLANNRKFNYLSMARNNLKVHPSSKLWCNFCGLGSGREHGNKQVDLARHTFCHSPP